MGPQVLSCPLDAQQCVFIGHYEDTSDVDEFLDKCIMRLWTSGSTVNSVVPPPVHDVQAITLNEEGLTKVKDIQSQRLLFELLQSIVGVFYAILVQLYAVIDAVLL